MMTENGSLTPRPLNTARSAEDESKIPRTRELPAIRYLNRVTGSQVYNVKQDIHHDIPFPFRATVSDLSLSI
jgi:hypothetical protein